LNLLFSIFLYKSKDLVEKLLYLAKEALKMSGPVEAVASISVATPFELEK